jgi:hypothetical protein
MASPFFLWEKDMPKVGNKEFNYTEYGMESAKKYANKTGKDIEYKAMGGNVSSYYNKGGKVAGCKPAMNNPTKIV